jgi:anaerobic magnesium-protoporphyrin IX monomethyl ester cyclase
MLVTAVASEVIFWTGGMMSAPAVKILLIYPPSRTQSHFSCPMGLLMLAAVLEKAGHEIHLLDANAANHRLSTEQIVEIAAGRQPDVIGITLVTPLVKEAYRLAAALRPCGARLIAGGPHATLLPEEPLENGFDAVVVGEGEPTVVEAVDAVLGRVPMASVKGLLYRSLDGRVQRNEPRPPVDNLDSLPAPARHLVNAADFGPPDNADLHAHIFTSRGCPGRCVYCAGGLFGKRFRFRSADSVVDEMIALNRDYGTRHFYFVDDAMTMDRTRIERICRRLIDERLGFTWNMMTRIDAVDEGLLALVSQAGCRQIEYGIESGNADTLKRIHKPHTAEMVRRIVPLTRRYGICPVGFFILGFPWEDPQATDATLQLMRELSPYIVFKPALASILIPFPGTELYDRYKEQYGFARWWLSDDRTYDAPRAETHALYETVMYRMGAILDADFFRYTAAMKAKIHEVFRFMYSSNARRRSFIVRVAALSALDLSRKLDAVSPRLERMLFKVPVTLWQAIKRIRGLRST